ncbi:TonB-dependent receptor [Bacteroides sp. 519]|uniref:TonB-dependent receptor n=1 Tax=Bacteroides sp. 519 TaxID=2302937 RepID=UPI0013CF75A9|nr:TonB-dependent receptor [Bacteroides sp. 519]NDV58904.1 TonB-dependent receptor [Bacteroides sp. 519]
MKKLALLLLSSLFVVHNIVAEDIPRDTLRVVDVEEIVVIATPKENKKLRELPNAVTLLSQQDMQANQVNSIKNLTALVPNIFIPDYGSRLTSAIYIRGIGSRINTPSVGLYVDNVPYIDKSAFDFNYADVERIDVLRGPQGTLYGRNTMGGLIRVYTKSPFTYQGTDVRLSAGTYNNYNASVTKYHRINEKFAFSAGGFYEHAGGFFKNSYNNKRVDKLDAGGGRIRAIWLPSDNLKLDFTVGYEYNDQGGYPYYYTGAIGKEEDRKEYIDKIAYNDEASYRRGLFNTGLNVEYQAKHFVLSAVTGFQNMKDRMFLDQDFTTDDIFNITQKQKLSTLSEEVVLKSKPGSNWQWTTGVFGFYQWLNTDGPVLFKEDGVNQMIEGNVNKIFAGLPTGAPAMNLDIKEGSLLTTTGNFDTPNLNLAVYHQSTYDNLFIEGLSFTAGLRLDYEKNSMKYNSGSTNLDYNFSLTIPMMPRPITLPIETTGPSLKGKETNDYLQLLPKFALKYDINSRNNIYASVSKGYRSGGYNVQMFSDIIQSELAGSMVNDVKGNLKEYMLNMGMTEPAVNGMLSMIPETKNDFTISESTVYKPEYSWNYEIGAHLNLFDNHLFADLAAFYMDTHDQQIARFSDNGFGRMTENAGTSRSYGVEAALRSQITNALMVNVNYGYTHATFRKYESNHKPNGKVEAVDYSGNYVPFVPQHTFSANGQYTWRFGENKTISELTANLGYSGAGKIYWTEANDVTQSFYGTVNARISAVAGPVQVDVWGRNIFDKEYASFYFESMQKGFMQKGRPAQFGVDVRFKF